MTKTSLCLEGTETTLRAGDHLVYCPRESSISFTRVGLFFIKIYDLVARTERTKKPRGFFLCPINQVLTTTPKLLLSAALNLDRLEE